MGLGPALSQHAAQQGRRGDPDEQDERRELVGTQLQTSAQVVPSLCEGIALTEGPLQSLEEGGMGLAGGRDLPAANGFLASSEASEGRCAPPAFIGVAAEPRGGGRLGKVVNLGEESWGLHWQTPQNRLRRGETLFDSRCPT